jgi:hypothetical protein
VNARLKCAALLSLFTIAGCGGAPKLDASSMAAYQASVKAMTADMTENQKRKFAADTMAALGPEAADENMKRTFSKEKSAVDPVDMYKPLDGMTVAQIEAKAAANKDRRKKK